MCLTLDVTIPIRGTLVLKFVIQLRFPSHVLIVDCIGFLGYSLINGGLSFANTSMFSTDNGDRPNVPDILVVLTDGEQTMDPWKSYPSIEVAANSLKQRGITVMVVAIGEEGRIKNETLNQIASSSNYIFRIGSYNDVYKLVFNVSTALCAGKFLVNSNNNNS